MMKVQKTTPQPVYDAEQFDGVNVPKTLLDDNGDLTFGAHWIMPALDWREERATHRPTKAIVLEVFTSYGGPVHLLNGYWVLRDECGGFEVWDDASFRANFTALNPVRKVS